MEERKRRLSTCHWSSGRAKSYLYRGRRRPQVLVSDLAQRHRIHSLKVRLRGTRSNREGLGAEVTVVLPDGRRILKLLDGKSGYLSQSDLPLYFGLADADHAGSIEVRWPSGRQQTVAGPIKSGTIEIVEK